MLVSLICVPVSPCPYPHIFCVHLCPFILCRHIPCSFIPVSPVPTEVLSPQPEVAPGTGVEPEAAPVPENSEEDGERHGFLILSREDSTMVRDTEDIMGTSQGYHEDIMGTS